MAVVDNTAVLERPPIEPPFYCPHCEQRSAVPAPRRALYCLHCNLVRQYWPFEPFDDDAP